MIHAYYNGASNNDYGLITDFNPNQDIIKLTSKLGFGSTVSPVSYSLRALAGGLGMQIYFDSLSI